MAGMTELSWGWCEELSDRIDRGEFNDVLEDLDRRYWEGVRASGGQVPDWAQDRRFASR